MVVIHRPVRGDPEGRLVVTRVRPSARRRRHSRLRCKGLARPDAGAGEGRCHDCKAWPQPMTPTRTWSGRCSSGVSIPMRRQSVELRETHISWVFLAGDLAYKVKKPLVLPFLDYGSLERRREMCREEVSLNRRLAPRIYLRVVGIAREGDRYRLACENDPRQSSTRSRWSGGGMPEPRGARRRRAGSRQPRVCHRPPAGFVSCHRTAAAAPRASQAPVSKRPWMRTWRRCATPGAGITRAGPPRRRRTLHRRVPRRQTRPARVACTRRTGARLSRRPAR